MATPKRPTTTGSGKDSDIIRLQPYCYIHVSDQNTTITRVEIGPNTFICQDNERVVFGPEKMITIPPRNYVVIKNPVKRDDTNGNIAVDKRGQIILRHGEEEIRLAQDPFPLYPGEKLQSGIQKLDLVPANQAYHLRALQTFIDDNDAKHIAGDEWLFEGPGLYIPNPNVEKVKQFSATTVKKNQALRLIALQDTIDRENNKRVAGEEWLVNKIGAYLPGVFEKIVSVVNGKILTEKQALHMRALRSFEDQFGNLRKSGEEWLITRADCECYIPGVYEEIVKNVDITILTSRQYCIILDPYDVKTRANSLGSKKLIVGEKSFFLQPGERLERGIEDVYVLSEEEGLILSAEEEFIDNIVSKDGTITQITRRPGDRWMLRGPIQYIPPVKAKVLRKNKAIPLHSNEGIYIRDIKSGRVRAEIGKTYLLNENEELWEKPLTPNIESLLLAPTEFGRVPEAELKALKGLKRDPTRVVSYRVPHNCVVQIYDYRDKQARVVFGPSLVMLGPDEIFTPLSLSGGAPKKPNAFQTLHLMLGPDFCTDIVSVETGDHAKLKLRLSYNWQFEIPEDKKNDPKWATKLFSISDFIGDACTAVASRIRGAVAAVPFDDFHKNSAQLIRTSVFGFKNGKLGTRMFFSQNNLVITGIDIQSIEPEDSKTREALQKSVQQAIEITTEAQQALAKQEAERLEQQARGKLHRQKINDQAEAEKEKKILSMLQADCSAVQTTGQARAEAQSRADAAKIKGQSSVEEAKLIAKAKKIKLDSNMKRLEKKRTSELKYLTRKQDLESKHKKRLAEIQTAKFQKFINAIGSQTIQSIATSGPDLQRQLLSALGIQSTLITDGSQNINLFQSSKTSNN